MSTRVSTRVRRIVLKEVRSTVHVVSDSAERTRTTESVEVAFLLRKQFHLATDPQESLVALYLSSRLRPIAAERISRGTIDRSTVGIRDVVRGALLSNATHVTVAHNHPSGNAKPSREDIAFTLALRKALELFDITLYDHIIIVSGDCHLSMAAGGWF